VTSEAIPRHPRVVAVVVTWNRVKLLTECLTMLRVQTRRPDVVVVVDNASTDGSQDVIRTQFPEVDLVTLTRNTGGAGGFSAGLAEAVDVHEADLVWVMDDDTIPTETVLAELLASSAAYGSGLGLVASSVVWIDGRDQPRNIPRNIPRYPGRVYQADRRAALAAGGRPVRTASFVSLLIEAGAIREFGLPTADFFIWNDDFEFTARLLRHRKGIYAPKAIVVHKTAELGTKLVDPGERFYNEVRNKIWVFRAGEAFAPAEACMRVGAALRNWTVFYWHSRNRAAMRRGLKKGLRDGFRTRPRPTREVLAEAGYDLAPHW
jgi:rhamnopyranosyl-N-acetylglucosaminyl-diphospho-decaprenol beta-1,3/1,4-galactofuranosyltransferase